jgi:REP element-mobilizing transposase RayT
VTICTKDRRPILADLQPSVGADDSVRPCVVSADATLSLTRAGEIVRECLERLNSDSDGVSVDKYAILPNHIHAILWLVGSADEGRVPPGGQSRPPLQRVIQRFKSISARRCWDLGYTTIWQRSFYDHVIRGEEDYLCIWRYIDENPARWAEDEYYSE